MVPRNSLCIHFFLGGGPTVTKSSVVPVLITCLVWGLSPLGVGGGVPYFYLWGVENRLLLIWSVLGIFPGVSIGNDSCSFRLFCGVDSLALSANF